MEPSELMDKDHLVYLYEQLATVRHSLAKLAYRAEEEENKELILDIEKADTKWELTHTKVRNLLAA